MGKLDGRVVIITGAARGQGEHAARLFAAEGAAVVLGDVLDEQGEAVAKDIREDTGAERALYVPLDVRGEDDWTRAVRAAKERFGHVDGLVNNAGVLRFGELARTSLAEYREVVDVNQIGCFLGMRAVVPELEACGGGTIVNTSSYAALSGMAYITAYAATKAAILGMTRVASMELAGEGIRVNAICPGAIDTPMVRPPSADGSGFADERGSTEELDAFYSKLVPQGRLGRPEEVARLALFLTCEDSSYISGQPFVIDGGWLAGVQMV
ncbi:SDR family NAD(P)-dependent oxidoreductase [Streptomyces boncukensis]|uniref:SDR family oxidoreductase n=1 Tax=Streptomyces boncukensis TaxID=2711219 RepID=A0A6G4X2H7_9ACTN|nr:SDR family NAD(P)-dependent oxidoreductase [Streptomyces boncukensis]NGO71705.1 SDR family oxidoreductase [Streptomyces boncukensis]